MWQKAGSFFKTTPKPKTPEEEELATHAQSLGLKTLTAKQKQDFLDAKNEKETLVNNIKDLKEKIETEKLKENPDLGEMGSTFNILKDKLEKSQTAEQTRQELVKKHQTTVSALEKLKDPASKEQLADLTKQHEQLLEHLKQKKANPESTPDDLRPIQIQESLIRIRSICKKTRLKKTQRRL